MNRAEQKINRAVNGLSRQGALAFATKVARKHGVSFGDMVTRHWLDATAARYEVLRVMRSTLALSAAETARAFGCDRKTVRNACVPHEEKTS